MIKTENKSNEHYTISVYSKDGNHTYKEKKAYNTELDAQSLCFFLNTRPETIHKVVCYKCSKCGKWHIGHHSSKILDATEKKKISEQFKKWKIIHMR